MILKKDDRHYFIPTFELPPGVVERFATVHGICYEDDRFYKIKLYKGRISMVQILPRYLVGEQYEDLQEAFSPDNSDILRQEAAMREDGTWTEEWAKKTCLAMYNSIEESAAVGRYDKCHCQSLGYPVRKWETPCGWLRYSHGGYVPVYHRTWANIHLEP